MASSRSVPSGPKGSPLLDHLRGTLCRSGCRFLGIEGTDQDGFRLSFEDRLLRRSGIRGFLFRLGPAGAARNRLVTTVRLPDSFESRRGARDPFGLFTTVPLGIEPVRGLVVGFDPSRHFPEDAPLRVSISAGAVRITQDRGWHSWLREGWERRNDDFAEALVGFRSELLLTYLDFEQTAADLDTGPRSLLADTYLDVVRRRVRRT